MQCSPIAPAALAAATANYATLLGTGATGEVYQGTLPDGTPIAVKRLKAPQGASPELLAALRARFRAELVTLSAFRHPRIVRLLHTCEATGDAAHPFALVLELLEGGALADWLRGPRGEAPPRGTLTPLQRVDAALGVAHGLKYLHGLREAGEDGSQAPVVHRDVKSANVGFSHAPGGELYAKVIDCGLAKALRGGGGGRGRSSGGGSSGGGGGGDAEPGPSVGVLGTPGYKAPELADGLYSVASEVYSFGVVLLELLRGQRVGLRTASAAREGAEDDGVGHVTALAEAAWPPGAAAALATLVVDCTHTRPKRRPQSMEPIVARLRELRDLLEHPVPLVLCPVCLDEVPEAQGVRCKAPPPAEQHFCCHGCLQAHVCASVSVERLARNAGGVPCVAAGCAAPPWTLEDLAPQLDPGALVAYATGMRYLAIDLPRLFREREAARAQQEEDIRRIADVAERVRRMRLQVEEEDFTLRCPRCRGAFVDFNGCAALYCKDDAGPPPRKGCGISFCALCLKDCEGDAHAHVKAVHAKPELRAAGNAEMYFFSRSDYAAAHRGLRLGLLAGRLAGLAGEPAVQEALLGALAGADLRGVGLSVAAVRAAAGMPAAEGAEGGGESAARVVERMRAGAGDAGVQEAGARALVALTGGSGNGAAREAALEEAGANYAERCEECVGAGAVGALVAALRAHAASSAGLAVQACGALRNIAGTDPGKEACNKEDAAAAIVAALAAHRGAAGVGVALEACKALCNIACMDDGQEACLAAGAVSAAVATLTAFADNAEVVEQACTALANIVGSSSSVEAVEAAGAVAALVAVLKAHAGVPSVVEEACGALSNMAFACSPCAESFTAPGVIPVLVEALRAHGAVAGVVEEACGALMNLVWDSSTHCAAIVGAGAVPLLAAAHAAHGGEARKRAHKALDKLGYTDAGLELGVQTAREVERMRAGAGDAGVQEAGARALVALAQERAGQEACVTAGAIPVLVAALAAHAGVAGVMQQASHALLSIGGRGPAHCAAIIAAGAVPLLAAAFAAHGGEARARASAALTSLGHTDTGLELPTAEMSAERVVEVMRAGAGDAAVAEAGTAALVELAGEEAGQLACVTADAVPAIVAALAAHAGSEAVGEQACRALLRIAALGAGEEACYASGAIPAIVAALRAHPGAVGVAKYACWALLNIGWSSAPHRAAIISAGAVPLLAAAHAAHAGEVRAKAREALRKLGYTDAGVEAPSRGVLIAREVELMRAGAGDEAVQEEGAHALVELAGDEAGQQACAAGGGAVPALVAALTAHAGAEGVAEQCCRALMRIASVGAGEVACYASGAIPAIVAALRAHPGAVGVVKYASWALLNIGWNIAPHRAATVSAGAVPLLAGAALALRGEARAKAREALARLGYSDAGVELPSVGERAARAVARMRAGAGDAAVQEAGARALAESAHSDADKQACVASGAVLALVAALTAHVGAEGVAGSACWALMRIAVIDAGQEACVTSGAVPAIVAALAAHAGVALVCKWGCWALLNIAWRSAPYRAAIVAAGAVPLLAAAAAAHGEEVRAKARDALSMLGYTEAGVALPSLSARVAREVGVMRAGAGGAAAQEAAAQALEELAQEEEGKEACIASGAVPAIVAALLAHPGEAGVAEQASLALTAICFLSPGVVGPGVEVCVSAGAIPALVAALKANGAVAEVVESVCRALVNLGWRSPAHRAAIVAAGAVPLCVAACAAHGGEAREKAKEVLGKLGYTEAGVALGAMGARAAREVERMRAGAGDGAVQEAAARALEGLAQDEEGKEACLAAGAVPALVAALQVHGGSAGVAEQACKALMRFAIEYAPGKEVCVAAGAVPVIVAALTAHTGSAVDAAKMACGALVDISEVASGAEACAAAGAVPAILAALQAHGSAAEFVEWACWALGNIVRGSPARCAALVAAGAVPALAATFAVCSGRARAKAKEVLGALGYTEAGELKQ